VITAVDTNVLLDIFGADPRFGPRSREALRDCLAEGGLVACEAVWAEVSAFFPSSEDAEAAMSRLEASFSPIDRSVAFAAGNRWGSYRRQGGARRRVAADFLIGAHALFRADRLLSRDRGFFRRYFDDLTILDPAAPAASR
jgi:predicted nucleic acid-binding protein